MTWRTVLNAAPAVAAFVIVAAGLLVASRREHRHQERMRADAYADPREDLT